MLTPLLAAEAEHFVMSHAQKVLPQRAKDWWHEYRNSKKTVEKEVAQNETVDGAEIPGWGVKEAEERNQVEASK